MANKNIVIAPCGNRAHLFKDRWLEFKEENYFFHLKDFKYHMLYNLFTNVKPEWLQQYEYFYFLDDDIEINTREINSIFLLSRAFQSSISQAALTHDSFCSWKMFRQQKNSFCRFVGQIEVMAPLFDREALIKCLPSFIGNR